MAAYENAIFISYAWGGEREEIVNEIDKTLQARGLSIIRDKRDLGYKGSITEFMERIGRGACIIVVVSDKYLKSPNCMFELVEIAENKQFHDRIFPIVLADANIYDPIKRIEYISYWETKRKELAEAIKTLDPANLQGIREDIDNYDRFRDEISGLTTTLKDMNTLTQDIHRDSNFETLYSAIESRLKKEKSKGEIMSKSEKPYEGKQPPRATTVFDQKGQKVAGDQVNVAGNYYDNRQGNSDAIIKIFNDLNRLVEKLPPGDDKEIAQKAVKNLKTEAEKGERADEGKVGKMMRFLLETAPDAWEVAVNTFLNPIAGIGTVFQKISERAKAEKSKG